MATTNFAALTDEQLTVWQRDTWKWARNKQFLSRFEGTDANAMIHRITELTQSEKGARAVITLVADLEGDGVAGDRNLEGNEEAMRSYDQVIQIDQMRHANRHEGRMADQRSVVRFRENSRDVLAYWLADRLDQLSFLTLSGVSYSKHTNGADRVGSDFPFLEFADDVSAPTSGRHFRWDAGGTTLEEGDTTAVDPADLPTWKMLVQLKAAARNSFLRPVRGDDGTEVYNVFMTPDGIARLKQDDDFLQAWRNAMPRSSSNPLFKGTEVIYVDGLAIFDYRHVYNVKGATAPNKWGGSGDVDGQRVIMGGAQALGQADIGNPTWVEKGFDYENQQGISVAKMLGLLKPKFRSDVSGQDEDFGVIVCDTAI